MSEREHIGQQAQEFCEGLWQQGDYWDFERSEYEQARCARLLRLLEGRRYSQVLEIGCGAGYFTRLLEPLADRIVAMDIAPTAIQRATALQVDRQRVDFRVANVMDYTWQADGPWDLIVFNDTICYLGWLYPFFDIAWLAAQLFATTRDCGYLLMANTMDAEHDKLLLPYITRTYRDLFRNVGFRLATEEIFRGTKNSVDFEILISLFVKSPETACTTS
jgi:SAM-dependent methyltransferase